MADKLGEPTIGLPGEQNTAPPQEQEEEPAATPVVSEVPINAEETIPLATETEPAVGEVETVPDTEAAEAAREAELESAIDFSERVESGEFERIAAQQGAPQMPDFGETYKASVLDIKAKYNLIQQIKDAENSYKQAGIPIPEDVQKQIDDAKLRVYGEASPFIDLNTGAIDTVTALKAGLNPDSLKAVGVGEDVINQSIAYINIQDLYGGDPLKAIEGGDIELVRTLYGGEATLDLQLALTDKREWEATVLPSMPEEYQKAYRDGDLEKLAALESEYQMTVSEFENWIKTEAPDELKSAYETGGIDAYNEAVAKYEAETIQSNIDRQQALAELEKLGYRFTLEELGIPVMKAAGDTSISYSDKYNIVGLLRDAISNDNPKLTIGAVPTEPERETVTLESGQVYYKPLKGKYEEPSGKNYQDALKLLKDAGFTDESIKEAQRIVTTTGGIAPFTGEEPGAVGMVALKTELNLQKWLGEKESQYKPSDTYAPGTAGALTGGALMAGLTLLVGLPMLAARIAQQPGKAPEIVVGAVNDLAKHVVKNVTKLATTGYINPYDLAYDTTTTALILSAAKAPVKAVLGKITTYVAPRGVPMGVIAKELSTGRIPLKQGLDKPMAEAMNQVLKQAMESDAPFTGEVVITGTPYKLRYLKTPLQEQVGGILWHASNKGLDFIKQQQGILKSGEAGLYTDPWAALNFARGDNPGLLMVITDAKNVKLPNITKLTESDAFIRQAKAGSYSPSKIYRGNLETEIVYSPKSKFTVPDPKADLATRILAGDYADFFTYDAGKFVPIKLAIDNALLKSGNVRIPTIADLYAAKIMTLENAIRDTFQAIKRPDLMAKDTVRSIAALKDIDPIYGSGGAATTFPGVRDVYTMTDWGIKIQELATKLFNKAKKKTNVQAKKSNIKPNSAQYNALFQRNLNNAYQANARALLRNAKTLSTMYSKNPQVRAIFENIYTSNLSRYMVATTRTVNINEGSRMESLRDTERLITSPISSYALTEPYSRMAESSVSPLLSETRAITSEGRAITSGTRPLSSESKTTTTERTPYSPYRRGEYRPVTSYRPPTSEFRSPTSYRPPTSEFRQPPYRRPPYSEYRPPPSTPPPPFVLDSESSGTEKKLPDGSLTWAQGELKSGAVWKFIPPPYNQTKPITLKGAPIGARNTGSLSPKDTIQIIGSAENVPKRVHVDLGFADIEILNGREIRFQSGGENTNVGTNDPSTTMGMSTLDSADFADLDDRTARKKVVKSSKPKKKKLSEFDYYTTLKGFRP